MGTGGCHDRGAYSHTHGCHTLARRSRAPLTPLHPREGLGEGENVRWNLHACLAFTPRNRRQACIMGPGNRTDAAPTGVSGSEFRNESQQHQEKNGRTGTIVPAHTAAHARMSIQSSQSEQYDLSSSLCVAGATHLRELYFGGESLYYRMHASTPIDSALPCFGSDESSGMGRSHADRGVSSSPKACFV